MTIKKNLFRIVESNNVYYSFRSEVGIQGPCLCVLLSGPYGPICIPVCDILHRAKMVNEYP